MSIVGWQVGLRRYGPNGSRGELDDAVTDAGDGPNRRIATVAGCLNVNAVPCDRSQRKHATGREAFNQRSWKRSLVDGSLARGHGPGQAELL